MFPELLLARAIGGYAPPVSAAAPAPSAGAHLHDHAVNLYDDEVDLVRAVALHVLDGGLTLGQRIVVIATPPHRAAIDEALIARGADPAEMRANGEYLALDAAETLAAFMVDGMPDPALFVQTIEGGLRRVSGDGRPPRLYGEMVALLWDEGNVAAAIALESLWNDLAGEHDFSLLCGYPMAALEKHPDLSAVRDVCRVHTGLVPPRRYRARTSRPLVTADVEERTEVFLRVPEAVGGVRRWLRSTLAQWGEHRLVDDAIVVVSELATNAIRHADSPFRVTITRHGLGSGSLVRLTVEDLSIAQPALNASEHEQLGGRGVHLVAQLANRWGVDGHAAGKTVWAEFDCRT
jgi:anti-sigma regulatory factor (Ser/Thr protein kinase)